MIGYALYAEKGKAVVKKTSEISRIAGISKRTLQFYDDEGVVKAERSGSNYRLYDERALGELWEVMIYKEAGMDFIYYDAWISEGAGEWRGSYI